VGRFHRGDSVSGLRQACRLAGAESVVATLWQIPDRATAQSIKDLITKLSRGAIQKSEDSCNSEEILENMGIKSPM
jgi:CHAT domain-containing protein